MLGKVMGCLEQVFIHDSFGHPIYFETFSGHGPVGEHILSLFEKNSNEKFFALNINTPVIKKTHEAAIRNQGFHKPLLLKE